MSPSRGFIVQDRPTPMIGQKAIGPSAVMLTFEWNLKSGKQPVMLDSGYFPARYLQFLVPDQDMLSKGGRVLVATRCAFK